jgi:hypothetical protein
VKLSAVVTRDDLAKLVSDFTPLRIAFGRGGRSISFGRPEALELVPGHGLRVRGSAKLVWDFAGLPLPVALRVWQVLLVPSVALRDGLWSIALDPVLEQLDVRSVPGFVDGRIATAINEGLASQRQKLAWKFGKTLTVRLALPARVSPASRFELSPSGGEVEVTNDELRFTVTFESRVVRLAEEALKRREETPIPTEARRSA